MVFPYTYLVVRRRQINSTEYAGLTKLMEKVVYIWYWEHVQTCLLVYTLEADTHVEFTGVFTYEEDGGIVQ